MILWNKIKLIPPPENEFLLFGRCGPNGQICRVESGVYRRPILPHMWATHWAYVSYTFVDQHECDCLFP